MNTDRLRALYKRSLIDYGEQITIRRYNGTGQSRTTTDATAYARVTEYAPEELAGPIVQGDAKLIVLAEDLEGTVFETTPPRKNEKVVVRSKELNIEGVDANTRRVGGTLIAYEIQARG